MTNTNKNVNSNNEMSKQINNLIKKIIKEDDINTLLSMIDNGLDINIFKYKNKTGINAIILYKYDNNKESVGNVIDMLLTRFQYLEDLQEDIANKLEELSYNNMVNHFESKGLSLEDVVAGFKDFLEALAEEVEDDSTEEEKVEDDSTEKVDDNKSTEDDKDNPVDIKDVENPNRGYLAYVGYTDAKKNNTSSSDALTKENPNMGYLAYVGHTDAKKDNTSNSDASTEENPSMGYLAYVGHTEEAKKEFHMIGDTDYKVSSISAYVTLDNEATCESKQVSIQASNIEELTYAINKEIEIANNENNEKLANSIIEMMNTNSEFKQNLLELMREAQLCK